MRPYEDEINKLPNDLMKVDYALNLLEYHLKMSEHTKMALINIGIDPNFGMGIPKNSRISMKVIRKRRLFSHLWLCAPDGRCKDVMWSNMFYDTLFESGSDLSTVSMMISDINKHLKEKGQEDWMIQHNRNFEENVSYFMCPPKPYPHRIPHPKTVVQDEQDVI